MKRVLLLLLIGLVLAAVGLPDGPRPAPPARIGLPVARPILPEGDRYGVLVRDDRFDGGSLPCLVDLEAKRCEEDDSDSDELTPLAPTADPLGLLSLLKRASQARDSRAPLAGRSRPLHAPILRC